MADACDASIDKQHDLTNILNKKLKTNIFTDSETLFNLTIRDPSNTEKKTYGLYQGHKRIIQRSNWQKVIWIR